jgi:hypothetical protein
MQRWHLDPSVAGLVGKLPRYMDVTMYPKCRLRQIEATANFIPRSPDALIPAGTPTPLRHRSLITGENTSTPS